MKLKYQISQTTTLDTKVLIDRILLKIKEKKYGIVKLTDKSVVFDCHNGGLTWNWEYSKRLESGKFEVISSGNYNNIHFEYCPIALSEYLVVCFIVGLCIILGLIIHDYFPGLIAVGFVSKMVADYFHLKCVAKGMLTEITDQN